MSTFLTGNGPPDGRRINVLGSIHLCNSFTSLDVVWRSVSARFYNEEDSFIGFVVRGPLSTGFYTGASLLQDRSWARSAFWSLVAFFVRMMSLSPGSFQNPCP